MIRLARLAPARCVAGFTGALLGALIVALATACSAFDPSVGPLRDAAAPTCVPAPTGTTGYGGYGGSTPTDEDAGAGCADAS